ncbi:hypothetical protein P43SY_001683 [Pythium insidiosum]|uniref:Uncharacterized protein n=1 Tax=Pythium insidiosum TaxID=114742 RepID=A0AAD5LGK1_PYTIN|nr:hypothetical protein P43SY_001683 [Pythium insidiosum]KAJ0406618.1 hypothetical protein ATCC90586_006118 [Pythium insidiosum]
MAFGTKKKEGMYLRPRVRRTTPLLDIALAVVLGGVSGVYIFKDTLQRWQQAELMEMEKANSKPLIPATADAFSSSNGAPKDQA